MPSVMRSLGQMSAAVLLAVLLCPALLRAAERCLPAAAPPGAEAAAVSSAAVSPDTLRAGRPVLLFFTASWCGPCRMVRQRTFADGEVAALLARLEVRTIDIDLPEHAALRARYASPRGGVPELVLLDSGGAKIGSLAGYSRDPARTAAFLRQALPADGPGAVGAACGIAGAGATTAEVPAAAPTGLAAPERSAVPSEEPAAAAAHGRRREAMPFVTRLFYSPWSLCVEAGPAFSRIAGSPFDRFRTGFHVGVAVNRVCARRWQVEAGLGVLAAGGRSDAGPLRSYRLVLPAEAQYRLWRGLHVAAGLYGACLVASHEPAGVAAGRWDAGLSARLLYEAGSFRLSCGYRRGLVQQPAGGRCEGIAVGVALCMGK